MNIQFPDYRRLLEPVLMILQNHSKYQLVNDISDRLIDDLDINVHELAQPLPSGRQTRFENQLQWALSYLEQDGLIECDGENGYRIRNSKQQHKSCLVLDTHQTTSLSVTNIDGQETDLPLGENNIDSEAIIAREFSVLYNKLLSDIIRLVHSEPPEFFEKTIIDLLLSMGYGDRKRDIAKHHGQSGDGGVDGAIQQDQLGLDVVYIQAKRYKPGTAVPVSSVRDFAGALEAQKANKGVFVTTSHFTKASSQFVSNISRRITLIDGGRLAALLVRNNIGVKISETWEIKHLDQDYFSKT